jgi:hypothetical protein
MKNTILNEHPSLVFLRAISCPNSLISCSDRGVDGYSLVSVDERFALLTFDGSPETNLVVNLSSVHSPSPDQWNFLDRQGNSVSLSISEERSLAFA